MGPQQTVEPPQDPVGFLLDAASWDRHVARDLAEQNDIGPLTEDHWKVIGFVRTYYLEHGEGPAIVKIAKHTGLTGRRICELFECGVVKGAYRLAGLPRPVTCV